MKALATRTPVFTEEQEAFAQWYAKTPMGKARERMIKGESAEADGDDGDGEGDGGKKKKGGKK